jgi:hypothetical protein
MRIKSIGSNKTELHLKDLKLLISYETPVCLIRFKGSGRIVHPAIKTDEFHSVTTSKHINTWLRENGFNPDKVPTMPQSWFNEFLDDNNNPWNDFPDLDYEGSIFLILIMKGVIIFREDNQSRD